MTTSTTKIKTLKNFLLGFSVGAVSLLTVSNNPANAATINFSVNYYNGVYGTGSMTGLDNNSDNLLTKNELTAFNFISPSFGHNFDLNGLFGFGSFNLSTGIWNADGAGWGSPTGSYFSWYNGDASIHSSWANITSDYVPIPPVTVPEPVSVITLLAFGTMGTASILKRKQQKKETVKA